MMDLLYEFTEWLRTTQLVELSLWIGETWLSLIIVTNFWTIPTVQTIHILFLGLAFGAVLMMNLRVMGVVGGHHSLTETSKRYMPWVRWAFLGLLVSGLLLIIGEPVRELINPIFWIKMGLIIVAIVAAVLFQRAVAGQTASSASGGLKLGAFAIIVLWLAIMAGGRWIAYAPV